MELHPRVSVVSGAEADIRDAVLLASDKYSLTFIELMGILASIISSEARFELRAERHPEAPDTPSGLL